MCCPAHKWRKRHEYTARLNSLDHLGWALPMDSSNVLLALDEQKKWRERRKRVRDPLRALGRRGGPLRGGGGRGPEENPPEQPGPTPPRRGHAPAGGFSARG